MFTCQPLGSLPAMSETTTPPADKKAKREMGIMGILGVAIGIGCLLMAALGALNTAFDWDLVLRIYGSEVEVPDSWDVVIGVAAFGVLLVGLTYFGRFVTGKFKDAKGKPLIRVGIIVAALGLLFLVGRGLQIVALTSTYGSMLAYYATDGDLEDVKSELAKDPKPEELSAAVGRAAQYDNVEALKLLVAAGAPFSDIDTDEEYRSCVVGNGDVSYEFLQVLIEAGASPENCPAPDEVIFNQVTRSRNDDSEIAKRVKLIAGAGFPLDGHPDYSDQTALAFALREQMPETAAALQAAGAK